MQTTNGSLPELLPCTTAVGLNLPSDLTWDQWVAYGAQLKVVESAIQFWVGDWINAGDKLDRERVWQELHNLGFVKQTVLNWASVARKIPPERRRARIDYSLQAALAYIEPKLADKLLDEAVEGEWTVRELREKMKEGSVGGSTKPSGDGPQTQEEQSQDTEAAAAYQAIDHHIRDFQQARKDGAAPKDVNYELTRLYDAIADHLGYAKADA
jgi:hypothetical protein